MKEFNTIKTNIIKVKVSEFYMYDSNIYINIEFNYLHGAESFLRS